MRDDLKRVLNYLFPDLNLDTLSEPVIKVYLKEAESLLEISRSIVEVADESENEDNQENYTDQETSMNIKTDNSYQDMTRILVLDDDISRIESFQKRIQNSNLRENYSFLHVSTAKECIDVLKNFDYDLIFLDHDLGGDTFVSTEESNTGSEVARWIYQHPHKIRKSKVFIHSFNLEGAQYMHNLIPGSILAPGVWTENIFEEFTGLGMKESA